MNSSSDCYAGMAPNFSTVDQLRLEERSVVLDDSTCSLPCWKGLIPGKSTSQDVLTTLPRLPFVKEESMHSDKVSIDRINLSYTNIWWASSIPDVEYRGGEIRVDRDDIVSHIRVDLNYETTLEDVTKTLGEPDEVFSALNSRIPNYCYGTSLVWTKLGIRIDSIQVPYKESITSNTPIEDVFFFELGSDEVLQADDIQAWKGFDAIPRP